mmetsp:Transcript_4910/g.13703  ORF Transcript_4910/g.13703 Transcript_4910/m.13703 type:complete len:240 (+) Transcript_4910:469-1188(+)
MGALCLRGSAHEGRPTSEEGSVWGAAVVLGLHLWLLIIGALKEAEQLVDHCPVTLLGRIIRLHQHPFPGDILGVDGSHPGGNASKGRRIPSRLLLQGGPPAPQPACDLLAQVMGKGLVKRLCQRIHQLLVSDLLGQFCHRRELPEEHSVVGFGFLNERVQLWPESGGGTAPTPGVRESKLLPECVAYSGLELGGCLLASLVRSLKPLLAFAKQRRQRQSQRVEVGQGGARLVHEGKVAA